MKFEEITPKTRQSYLASIKDVMEGLLYDRNFEGVEESIVTDAFIQQVVEGLEKESSSRLWVEVDFEITDEEMKQLVIAREKKMRNVKISRKQYLYFLNMINELGIEEEIELDYLLFQKRMTELIELHKEIKPATEKQIATVKRLWEEKFGEEIILSENVTMGEISRCFATLNEGVELVKPKKYKKKKVDIKDFTYFV
ncbi:hypothetical protein [Bacillus cereus group sp. Bce015]|uniref:hypothetical protein n=1 Tax=Bacillus cereus group sp. Bce015 TaxID=3445249 RepID=UPI003F20DED3